jgi:hypothetical protein
VGANAQGRNAAFPSLRPVPADQCRSQQGCLLTMRVQLRGCSSAQRFRAHSRRYGSCGYRHALQVPARDAPSFACACFSLTAQEFDRRCLDAPLRRDHHEKRWPGRWATHLELPWHRTLKERQTTLSHGDKRRGKVTGGPTGEARMYADRRV